MGRTLYDIDVDIMRVLNLDANGETVNEETGEVLDASALDGLQMELEAKVEGCALIIKNARALAKSIDEEAEALRARRRAIDNHVAALLEYMRSGVELAGGRVETPRARVTLRKATQHVEIDDAAAIPARWLVPQEPKIDKKGIADALRDGGAVPGAHMESGAASVIIK